MVGSSSTSYRGSSRVGDFQPARADWRNPKDLGRCVRWLWGQKDCKLELEQRTARNIAFVEGRQNDEWDWRKRTMRLPDVKRGQFTAIYNTIKPLLKQRRAKMLRSEPVWNIPAATADERDQVVARFSNDVMRWYYKEGLDVPAYLQRLFDWMDTSPITFVHPMWNPTKGDAMQVTLDDFYRPIPPEASPELANAMRAQDLEAFKRLRGYDERTDLVTQYTGDIDLGYVDIFRAMWYPFRAPTWSQVSIFLKSDVLPLEDVCIRYGLKLDDVERYARPRAEWDRYQKMVGAWTSPYLQVPNSSREWDNGVLVHQLFVTKELCPPRGASAVVIGDSDEAILWGTLGNKFAELPFRPLVDTPTPGCIWGTCVVDDLIWPQIELNTSRTQLTKYRQNMLMPKIVRIKNDGADDESFKSDNPDKIIEVDSKDRAPIVLHVPPSGQDHGESVAFALRYMHDATAVPDVALGRTDETGVRSGVGVRSLQEEANERLKVSLGAIDRVMAWTGQFLLGELQDKAVAQRVIPLVGSNNSIEYLAWSRSMLRPTIYEKLTSNVALVQVSSFSNIPTTPQEARNTAVVLTQLGVLKPGVHDHVYESIFGFDNLRSFLDKTRSDRDKAEREISIWRSGQPVGMPASTDDHAVHEEVHAAWIKSEEFAAMRVRNPALAQDVVAHYEAHCQGKFDDAVRAQLRQQYAGMRMNAEFAMKSVVAGRPDWAMIFAMQSNGGMGVKLGGQPQYGPDGLPASSPNTETEAGGVGGAEGELAGVGGAAVAGSSPLQVGMPPAAPPASAALPYTGRPGERIGGGGVSGGAQGSAAMENRHIPQGKDGAHSPEIAGNGGGITL